MRLSGLSLAVVFLLSSFVAAQHSAGSSSSSGSSSSGSSSGSSGGGSHSSSSGGSSYSGSSGGGHSSGGSSYSGGSSSHSSGGGGGHSYSGGGHSSGGSHVSGGSTGTPSVHSSGSSRVGTGSNGHPTHGTSLRGTGVEITPRNGVHGGITSLPHPVHGPEFGLPARAVQPPPQHEKKSFFAFFRHPFHKAPPAPKPDARKGFCFRGHCPVCPVGQSRSGGQCVGAIPVPTYSYGHTACYINGLPYSYNQLWYGNNCFAQTRVMDDCSGLRLAWQRQAERINAARSQRQSACSNGVNAECSSATTTLQSEENLYRALEARYRQCLTRVGAFNTFGGPLFIDDSGDLMYFP